MITFECSHGSRTGRAGSRPFPFRFFLLNMLTLVFLAFSKFVICRAAQQLSSKVAIAFPPTDVLFSYNTRIFIRAVILETNNTIAQVRFYDDTNLLGIVTHPPYTNSVSANGTTGPQIITAVAIDNFGNASTSAPVRVLPIQPPTPFPIFEYISPTNGVTFAAPATFKCKARLFESDGKEHPMNVYLGTNLVGTTSPWPPYEFTVSNLVEGDYQLGIIVQTNAAYFRRVNLNTLDFKVGKTNNNPPSVRILWPDYSKAPRPVSFYPPALVRIAVVAQDSEGSIEQVDILRDGELLASLTNAPFVLATNFPAPKQGDGGVGLFGIFAKATDNAGAARLSDGAGFWTEGLFGPPLVAVDSPVNGSFINADAMVTIKARLIKTDNNVNPIEFYDGESLIGSVLDPPYELDYFVTNSGPHIFSAKIRDLNGVLGDSQSAVANAVGLRLESLRLEPGARFAVDVFTELIGKPITFEASLNLLAWVPLETNVPTMNRFFFLDAEATNYSCRFYRVRLGP